MRLQRQNIEGNVKLGDACYTIKRSLNRNTLEIRIRDASQVEVLAPAFMPGRKIHGFIEQKSHWISRKLAEARERKHVISQKRYANGREFLFLGDKYPLMISEENIRKAQISFKDQHWHLFVPNLLTITQRERIVKSKLIQWYQRQARELFGARAFHYARLMGVDPQRISVKTQKCLWGSCGFRSKSINLNWLLILSPLAVIDYVIVHELSHLFFPNHSKMFWDKVAGVLPDYKFQQKWLKDNRLAMILP